jgi:hypothetical protein
MKACIVRKVIYMAADQRPRWGFILAERQGVTLLLVPCNKDGQSHELVIAAENVVERTFEDVNLSRFPLEGEDMTGIGAKLAALGDGLAEDEFEKFLRSAGLDGLL